MSSVYSGLIKKYKEKRRAKFAKMSKEKGYLEGTVLHFDNERGVGLILGEDSLHYVAHYKNMHRMQSKILAKSQRVHFKPGKYEHNLTADDIAVIY